MTAFSMKCFSDFVKTLYFYLFIKVFRKIRVLSIKFLVFFHNKTIEKSGPSASEPLELSPSVVIYDCFLFLNELDLLEVHLAELDPYVDRFVLVEAKESYRGKDKPLVFLENKKRYEKYLNKIIHIIVEKMPAYDAWEREFCQRNALLNGLKECTNDDIIIVTDLDEIVRGSEIPFAVKIMQSHKCKALTFQQHFYRWFLNRKESYYWKGSVITSYEFLKKKTPQGLRDRKDIFPMVKNGGWHFSNMGGLKVFVQKLESFSHAEADLPANKNPDAILSGVRANLKLVPLDSSFPLFIQERIEYFKSRNFIDIGQGVSEYTKNMK